MPSCLYRASTNRLAESDSFTVMASVFFSSMAQPKKDRHRQGWRAGSQKPPKRRRETPLSESTQKLLSPEIIRTGGAAVARSPSGESTTISQRGAGSQRVVTSIAVTPSGSSTIPPAGNSSSAMSSGLWCVSGLKRFWPGQTEVHQASLRNTFTPPFGNGLG